MQGWILSPLFCSNHFQKSFAPKSDRLLGDYLETTLDDIAIANDLAHQLFGHSLDDLSQPGRELLRLTADYVAQKANGGASGSATGHNAPTFNRRELREAFKWGDTRLRTHLDELVEMEYVLPLSGRFGQTYQYRLLYTPTDEPGRFLSGLKSVEQLRKEANLAGILGDLAPRNGHLAPTSQGRKREVAKRANARQHEGLLTPAPNLAPFSGEHITETHSAGRAAL